MYSILPNKTKSPKLYCDHVKKYYHFDASKTKYKIEDLDEVDKLYISVVIRLNNIDLKKSVEIKKFFLDLKLLKKKSRLRW